MAQNYAVADFNRDGKTDVLLRAGNELQVFLGNGDGTFATQPLITPFTAPAGTLIVGSFNKDTAFDVAFRSQSCESCNPDTIYVLLNDGTGKFVQKSANNFGLSSGSPIGTLAAGDLNNDGVQDIVFSNNGQTGGSFDKSVMYLLNKGDGTFSTQYQAASMTSGAGTPVLRHLNLDSQMDILAPSDKLYTLLATNAPTNCTPPGTASLRAKFCTPANNGTVSNTFTVKASGDSPAGVSRMQLFVDGKKVDDVLSDQLRKSVTVGSGSHRLTVRAYDKYAGSSQTTIYVNAN